jgi:hypothetical protein
MSTSITSRFFFVFILSLLSCSQSSAKGSYVTNLDHPNKPQNIENLPPEVRAALIHQCRSTPKALYNFASYTENPKRILLRFKYFYCNSGDTFCGPSGCLHQIYVSSHGHYRLLRSYYSPAED